MFNLYIVQFNDDKYVIKNEDILEIIKSKKVHLLQFDQKQDKIYFSECNAKFIYLYDLSFYLGYDPFDINKQGRIILMSNEKNISGFIINHEDEAILKSDKIIKIPEFFKNDFINSCAIIGKEVIPVLNIRNIFERIFEYGYKFPDFESNKFITSKSIDKKKTGYNIYQIGGYFFCIDNNHIKINAINAEKISKISFYPRIINGLSIHEDMLIPVIDLYYIFYVQYPENRNLFIIDFNNKSLGFLVDSFIKHEDNTETEIFKLPEIVKTAWMNEAVIHDNNIFPLVDPHGLTNDFNINFIRKHPIEDYFPNSKFNDYFCTTDIEILEFEISGIRFGIPREEVAEYFDEIQSSIIPLMPFIVIGVVRYSNEILPVVDLSRFLTTGNYSTDNKNMIYLKNGNFKSLILAEKISGYKIIEKNNQKKLPIRQNFQFIYGCYIDGDKHNDPVKLILNIETIALFANDSENDYFKDYFNKHIKESFKKINDEIINISQNKIISDNVFNKYSTSIDKDITVNDENKNNKLPSFDETINQIYQPTINMNDNQNDNKENENINTDINETFGNNEKILINNESSVIDEYYIKKKIKKKGYIFFTKNKIKILLFPVILILLFLAILYLKYFDFNKINNNFTRELPEQKNDSEKINSEIEVINQIKRENNETKKNENSNIISKSNETSIKFDNILFLPDSSELQQEEKNKLIRINEIISKYSNVNFKIIISGHTALFGTEEGRNSLSKLRADIVYEFFKNNIEKNRFIIKAMGAKELIGDNNTIEGNIKNRRVEISIIFN